VTSAAADEGKITVAASLAQILELSGADFVAVDFDLRNSTLHGFVGANDGCGSGTKTSR
jgi:Mrp family chromosome partitioning ATPase